MDLSPYRRLAQRLDELPNGFPPTASGAELRLLARLFTPEEAEVAAHLRLTPETAQVLAERIGADPAQVAAALKGAAHKCLITAQRTPEGLAFGLMPFVVGFWEEQGCVLDAELAGLFEAYYLEGLRHAIAHDPPVQRVVPVGEAVAMDLSIDPRETVVEIINRMQAWGVLDCICRKELALLGKPCGHPIDVCMALSQTPNAFANNKYIKALSREEALDTLHRAAEAGLVHTVSNSQRGVWYICNCCTCGCGILRSLAELGVADVVARSPYVNRVQEDLCVGCEVCVAKCPFGALAVEDVARVDGRRCVGCGVCVGSCPQQALGLVPRPPSEVTAPPETQLDWLKLRAQRRGIDLAKVL